MTAPASVQGGRLLTRLPAAASWPSSAQSRLAAGGAALVLAYACGAFLIVNYLFPGRLPPEADLYLAQPAIWTLLAFLSLVLFKVTRSVSKVSQPLLALALLVAAFHIAWLIGAGTAFGFGYSPYSRQPLQMAQNGLYIGTLVLGIEFSRAYLVAIFGRGRPFAALSGISLFYALMLIPVSAYSSFRGPESSFETLGAVFLPAVGRSVALTYLAARGGPVPAILYHGGIEAFHWFSPILPDLEWTTAAFINTLAPIVGILVVRGLRDEPETTSTTTPEKDISAVWIVPSIFLVALLWFNTGMLGFQPAVVSGVSMEPYMEAGDLALTRPVDSGDLQVGDVIRFSKGGLPVMHRIIEIESTAQGRVFVTQGDNNNTPDDPILAGQIEGRVVLVVPKLGWVPITLGRLLNQLR